MSCSFKGCERPVFVIKTTRGPLCNGHYKQHRLKNTLTALRSYTPRVAGENANKCTEPGCDRPSQRKKGPCQTHSKNGGKETIREYEFQIGKECQISGCEKPAKAKGYCTSHYRSAWGDCTFPGCTRKMYSKKTQLCAAHYAQLRKAEKATSTPIDINDAIDKHLKPIRDKKENS